MRTTRTYKSLYLAYYKLAAREQAMRKRLEYMTRKLANYVPSGSPILSEWNEFSDSLSHFENRIERIYHERG